ncbi:leukocyte-associated immunoglobulin-like receptor 2 isoform X1 [Pongo pygmaeus]|uniref:leukocyte-associated immunoglobulin-like receptor 2 isoform X1 n=1 Tax=Pongo pygmaeus TaxID=9600 RepID=UPI0023E1E659|nr:leukocyte-associated immunoglobulin-like receptor 2 isoform X1 [Pongo pygmaeus]
MNLPPTIFLGLMLCLARMIHTQEGALPRPSISAEPGTTIPRGSRVTFVCRGPAGVQTFRLERESRFKYNDTNDVSQASSSESEARFHIDSVSEDSAGCYRCYYFKSSRWSEHSDYLELLVKGAPDEVSPSPTEADSSTAPITQNFKVKNIVCMSLAGVVLLILAVILAEAWHSERGMPIMTLAMQTRGLPSERLDPRIQKGHSQCSEAHPGAQGDPEPILDCALHGAPRGKGAPVGSGQNLR